MDCYSNMNKLNRIENHSEHESPENDKWDRFVEVHLKYPFLVMIVPDCKNYTEDNESSLILSSVSSERHRLHTVHKRRISHQLL